MPITRFQSEVLQTLAAQRDPESYVAGGIAINRHGPRVSQDIDIFHDSESRLESAVKADTEALEAARYNIGWERRRDGRHQATVSRGGDAIRLDWVTDSAFRFFPTQSDDLFGYVLHPVDLATNKASAAADRRVSRDVVDLVTIHERILPLGAVIAAAVGRFPGTTPEEMLAEINQHSRFTAEEFQALATVQPIDIRTLHRRVRDMIDSAAAFIATLPSEAVGMVFMEGGKAVQPDVTSLDSYQRRSGTMGGVWPSSPDIVAAMLERSTRPKS